MFTTTNSVIIKADKETIWHAQTISSELPKYMESIEVVSDWKVGSSIVYTCYDDNEKVAIWNGKEMIWDGVITIFEPNSVLELEYPGGETGVLREKYVLKAIDESTTTLNFEQDLVDEKAGENYKEGNELTLQALQKYCEKEFEAQISMMNANTAINTTLV